MAEYLPDTLLDDLNLLQGKKSKRKDKKESDGNLVRTGNGAISFVYNREETETNSGLDALDPHSLNIVAPTSLYQKSTSGTKVTDY